MAFRFLNMTSILPAVNWNPLSWPKQNHIVAEVIKRHLVVELTALFHLQRMNQPCLKFR